MILEDEGIQEAAAPPPVEEGAPLWTVTFGDMMSLLLTFFILMYSMSELKQDRFLLASKSLNEAIGGTADEAPEDPMGVLPDSVDPALEPENPGLSDGAVESELETGAEAGDIEGPWLESVVDAYSDMIARKLEEFVRERAVV